MNVYWVAAAWIGLALVASLISIWAGISVALVELLVGAVVGNIPGASSGGAADPVHQFLATLGSAVLTFLAGAEIDPDSLRRNWRASISLGLVSFAAPFAGALFFARLVLDWSWPASQIAGVALSTTSVAVVYAVMIESGLNRQEIGKLILAACFVTDLGTVLALGGMFADANWVLLVFVAMTALAMWFMPRATRFVLRTVGGRSASRRSSSSSWCSSPSAVWRARLAARRCFLPTSSALWSRGCSCATGSSSTGCDHRLRAVDAVLLHQGRAADLPPPWPRGPEASPCSSR